MKIERFLIAVFLINSLWSEASVAQQPPPTQFQARLQFSKDLASVLKQSSLMAQNAASRSAAHNKISESEREVLNSIKWSKSTGALFEVRVEKHIPSSKTSILGSPQLVGVGKTPQTVLTHGAKVNYLRPEPRNGFVLSWSDSFYVWAEPRISWFGLAEDHLEYAMIPSSFTEGMRSQAFAASQDREVLSRLLERRRDEVYQNAVSFAVQELEDQQLQLRLAAINSSRLQAQSDIDAINQQLNKELDAASELAAFQNVLGALSAVLDTAEVAGQLSSMGYKDAQKRLEGATPQQTQSFVEELRAGQEQRIEQARQRRDSRLRVRDQKSRELEQQLKNAGAPAAIFPASPLR